MGNRFNRKDGARKENKIIYIFTEGEGTEPIYFKSKKKEIEKEIRRKGIKIEIKGIGFNTLSLVDFAMSYVENEKIDLTLDDCWIVFDKDDFDKNFDNAISKAQTNGLKVAYSNEAFELWFLLHFSFMDSAIGRADYNNKLTENLKKISGNKNYKYDKVNNIYPLISNKESDATRNARKLLKQYDGETSFSKKNPSTTVHLLVEDLNKLKD